VGKKRLGTTNEVGRPKTKYLQTFVHAVEERSSKGGNSRGQNQGLSKEIRVYKRERVKFLKESKRKTAKKQEVPAPIKGQHCLYTMQEKATTNKWRREKTSSCDGGKKESRMKGSAHSPREGCSAQGERETSTEGDKKGRALGKRFQTEGEKKDQVQSFSEKCLMFLPNGKKTGLRKSESKNQRSNLGGGRPPTTYARR